MKYIPIASLVVSGMVLLGAVFVTSMHASVPPAFSRLARPPEAPDAALLALADDPGLAARVRSALAEDREHLSQTAIEDIRIEARHGIVRLRGVVPLTSDKLLVGLLARSVEGVRAVMNELIVSTDDPQPCPPDEG